MGLVGLKFTVFIRTDLFAVIKAVVLFVIKNLIKPILQIFLRIILFLLGYFPILLLK